MTYNLIPYNDLSSQHWWPLRLHHLVTVVALLIYVSTLYHVPAGTRSPNGALLRRYSCHKSFYVQMRKKFMHIAEGSGVSSLWLSAVPFA
jgi:hypothetical protein